MKVLGRLSDPEADPGAAPATVAGPLGLGSPAALVAALLRRQHHAAFARFAVHVLGNLASDAGLKAAVGDARGVEAVIAVLQAHQGVPLVVEAATYTLAQLTLDSVANCARAVTAGACELVAAIAKAPRAAAATDDSVSYVLESCMFIINNICRAGAGLHVPRMLEAGAEDAVCFTVLQHVNTVGVLYQAFGALPQLAATPAGVAAVVRTGAVQGCVVALREHAHHSDIVDVAVRVLVALASSPEPAHLEAMAEHGAPQTLLEVACSNRVIYQTRGQQPEAIELALTAVRGLRCLTAWPAIAEHVARASVGGIEAVSDLLSTFGHDAEAVTLVTALCETLTLTPFSSSRVLTTKTAAVVLAAVRRHSAVADAVISALRIFANLSALSDEAAAALLQSTDNGVVSLCFDLFASSLPLASPTRSPYVTAQVFLTLGAVARTEPLAAAVADNVFAWAHYAFRVEVAPDRAVLVAAATCLANLFVFASVAAAAAAAPEDSSCVTAMLAALSAHTRDAAVVAAAVKPLENMACASQVVRDQMKALSVLPALEDLAAAFASAGDNSFNVGVALQAAITAVSREDFVFSG